ncbi:hypothetical protein TrRE_jg3048 [Triparma retinervis]|uniref:NAD(P)-binding domain-containing protein n=1 Tax=Triparma retinervis TaxID=2557542 RepID=A0A9W7FEZ6_9STRA|nr:hypothetical protein TrRE_jg3048 [Triparma retinervis]
MVVERLLKISPQPLVIAMTSSSSNSTSTTTTTTTTTTSSSTLPTNNPNLKIMPYSPSHLPQPCTLIHCSSDTAKLAEFTRTFPMYSKPKGRTRLLARMNPGKILDAKARAEASLRRSNVPYAIVRPTGLKDAETWPSGRPVFSQGDYAVGRTTPEDLADVLVECGMRREAEGKTFEIMTLTGYPKARDMGRAMGALVRDGGGEGRYGVYGLLQQLLPGEEQDATALEMGRSYEGVDGGKVGKRVGGAAPTEREIRIAKGLGGEGA